MNCGVNRRLPCARDGNLLEMAEAALGGAKLASPRRDLALGFLETGLREPHRTCFTTVSKVPSAQILLRRVRARTRGGRKFSRNGRSSALRCKTSFSSARSSDPWDSRGDPSGSENIDLSEWVRGGYVLGLGAWGPGPGVAIFVLTPLPLNPLEENENPPPRASVREKASEGFSLAVEASEGFPPRIRS